MNALKILFVSFLVFFLVTPTEVFSQKKSEKSQLHYRLFDDAGNSFDFYAPGVKVKTPSGNLLWTGKVKVPAEIMENIDFAPFANDIKEYILTITSSGDVLYADAYLNKAGNLHFELHKNGAGTKFPKGWF